MKAVAMRLRKMYKTENIISIFKKMYHSSLDFCQYENEKRLPRLFDQLHLLCSDMGSFPVLIMNDTIDLFTFYLKRNVQTAFSIANSITKLSIDKYSRKYVTRSLLFNMFRYIVDGGKKEDGIIESLEYFSEYIEKHGEVGMLLQLDSMKQWNYFDINSKLLTNLGCPNYIGDISTLLLKKYFQPYLFKCRNIDSVALGLAKMLSFKKEMLDDKDEAETWKELYLICRKILGRDNETVRELTKIADCENVNFSIEMIMDYLQDRQTRNWSQNPN